MWDALVQRVGSDVDVTYFDVTGKFDKTLSVKHNISDDQLITAPPDSALQAHFVGTPTTVLIGRDGRVRHVWAGVLDESKLGQIVAMTQADSRIAPSR